MTSSIGSIRTGIVLASVVGGWHLCWAILVAMGLAQAVIDFVLWMHFIKPVYMIAPFDFARAITLVVVTTIGGFLVGAVFAWVWNALHKA